MKCYQKNIELLNKSKDIDSRENNVKEQKQFHERQCISLIDSCT